MKLLVVLQNKAEEITGTVTGSVVGVIAHRTFADILITLGLALVTGFLGALGAFLFKLAKNKLSSYNKVRDDDRADPS